MKHVYIITRRLVLPALLCSLTAMAVQAQDIHFSQFFEAPLLRNPSLAGLFEGDYRTQAVYRDQWKSITPNSYRSVSFNGEYKMPVGKVNDFLTIGGQMLLDKAGSAGLRTTHVLPVLNYHKSLSPDRICYLSVGFMGGWVQRRIDLSQITTSNQYGGGTYNPGAPTGENITSPSISYWDASVGMSFNIAFGGNLQHLLFVGAAYQHLSHPKNSFYLNPEIELYPKKVFSAGIKLMVNDRTTLTLHQDAFMQNAYREVIGGGMLSYKLGDFTDVPVYIIHGGLFVRWKDAAIPVIKLTKKSMSVTLSYDINISELKTASQGRGGFELGISYNGFLDRDNTSRDKVLCPEF
ncbi:MAG: PorP/SprF family type IX secretion system membrane protein [Bacteroidetes bacterium]|nr:PorP/SprF family type IX secretion system membrane protein [Bacteroidota bacterium]